LGQPGLEERLTPRLPPYRLLDTAWRGLDRERRVLRQMYGQLESAIATRCDPITERIDRQSETMRPEAHLAQLRLARRLHRSLGSRQCAAGRQQRDQQRQADPAECRPDAFHSPVPMSVHAILQRARMRQPAA
jgi:hypothetical protein